MSSLLFSLQRSHRVDFDQACRNDQNDLKGREEVYMWLWTGAFLNVAVFYLLGFRDECIFLKDNTKHKMSGFFLWQLMFSRHKMLNETTEV